MSITKQKSQAKGFTIVEMLVVAPIVILAIGAFISVIVNLTGEVLATRSSNALVFDIQDTLSRIEEDVKLSTTFLAENNISTSAAGSPITLTSPQGYGNDTVPFTNVSNDPSKGDTLILNTLATNGNPLATTSSIFYIDDQPNDCASTQLTQNTPMTMNIVYFVKDSSLWRRVIAPANYNTAGCPVPPTLPWQQPSCNPDYMTANPGSSTFCAARDAELLTDIDVDEFDVSYFSRANATTPDAIASDTAFTSTERNTAMQALPVVGVSITVTKTAAGRDIEQSGTLRATRLDINSSTIAPVEPVATPAAPSVLAVHTQPASATFSWPSVPGATGYTFKYNTTGGSCSSGSWTTAFSNQNTISFTTPAQAHNSTVYGCATATNSSGTSAWGTQASVSIPLWATPLLQNNWSNYDTVYSTAAYTKTSSGIVILKGSLKRSGAVVNGEVIANLPEGYRPQYELNFIVAITGGNTGSIEIHPNGNVVAWTDANATFTSLDRIAFLPSDSSYTWTNFSPISNGWSNRSATDDPPFSYTVDSTGRFHMRGALSPGTITDGTTIVSLPVSGQMSPKYIMAVRSGGGGLNALNISTTVSPRGIAAGTAVFPNLSYYPNAYAGWTALSFLNSWTNFDAANTTAAYTKSSDNVVSVKGLVRSGTGATFSIGTLPAGFRPKETLTFASVCNNTACRVNISPTGAINLTQGSTTWSSLSGINFIAEQ